MGASCTKVNTLLATQQRSVRPGISAMSCALAAMFGLPSEFSSSDYGEVGVSDGADYPQQRYQPATMARYPDPAPQAQS